MKVKRQQLKNNFVNIDYNKLIIRFRGRDANPNKSNRMAEAASKIK